MINDLNLYITNKSGVKKFHNHGITHILSIGDPLESKPFIKHFNPIPIISRLEFHDIKQIYFQDSDSLYSPPNEKIIRKIIDFGLVLRSDLAINKKVSLLVHCHAGISRSTAAAYIILNILAGKGKEQKCLDFVREIRPHLVPNYLMAKIADSLLDRNNELVNPVIKNNSYSIFDERN